MKKRYSDWVNEYPGYTVIRKEGFFYTAKDESAEILHRYLGYKIGYINDIAVTGSPVLENILTVLESHNVPYVVIEDNKVVEKNY